MAKAHRFPEVSRSLAQIAAPFIGKAAAFERSRKARVETDRLVIVALRCVEVAKSDIHKAAAVEAPSKPWVEADRLT